MSLRRVREYFRQMSLMMHGWVDQIRKFAANTLALGIHLLKTYDAAILPHSSGTSGEDQGCPAGAAPAQSALTLTYALRNRMILIYNPAKR
jgi:hypothetical protein